MIKNEKDKIIIGFIDYLVSINTSGRTIKNYKSDLNHFKSWLILKLRGFGVMADEIIQTIPFLKDTIAKEYKNYLVENNLSVKTVNRRLSSLRQLSKYLLYSQIISNEFTKDLTNIHSIKNDNTISADILEEFQKHLEAEKISKNTVKNYLADIRQFVNWFEKTRHLDNSQI